MRSQWTVSKNSWHGRLYLFWKRHASWKTKGYRENLCHYVRVLLFWAPISLFINLQHPKHRWVRPWTVFMGVTIPTALAVTTWMFPGEMGRAFLVALGIITAAAVFCGLLALFDTFADEITAWLKKWGPKLFGWVPKTLLAVGHATEKVVGGAMKALARPFMTVHGQELPWIALIAAVVWAVAVIIQPKVLLWSGLILVGGAAFLAVAFLLAEGLHQLGLFLQRRRASKPKRTDPTFFQVATGFVVAKKHRVCPLIDVEE
jgi:hypothetical protein